MSTKDWDGAFFQWSMACRVRREKSTCESAGFSLEMHRLMEVSTPNWFSELASIRPRRLLSMNGYSPWHFIIVGIELKVSFKSSVVNKTRKALNGRTISDPWKCSISSAALASPLLLPDSKSFLSDSDIFAASARGSCGVDPCPIRLRIELARDPL